MPSTTEVETRNRALIAFTALTGARAGALASFKLKHVNLIERHVMQDASEVNTKFGKTFTTGFFPVGADIEALATDWVTYLLTTELFVYGDPLFPSTVTVPGATQKFEVGGLTKEHWSSSDPTRAIFQGAFEAAGLPYYHPHSFRRMLVLPGERVCRTHEDFKCWSQNLGHEDVMTTFRSYGTVPRRRQADVIRRLALPAHMGTSAMRE